MNTPLYTGRTEDRTFVHDFIDFMAGITKIPPIGIHVRSRALNNLFVSSRVMYPVVKLVCPVHTGWYPRDGVI